MKLWEVQAIQPELGQTATVYLKAPSEVAAQRLAGELAEVRGLRVESVRSIEVSTIPGGSKVYAYRRPSLDPDIRAIANSLLIRYPVATIAVGVMIGSIPFIIAIAIIVRG